MDMQAYKAVEPANNSGPNVAKRSLASIKGSVVPLQIKLNHPVLRKTFKHTYDICDAHFYYCFVFCRATLSPEVTTPELELLRNLIKNAAEEVEAQFSQGLALADSNGVGSGSNLVEQIVQTQASTPISKQFLDIYRKADRYLALVDGLWIEGVLDDDAHAKAASKISQSFHKLSRQVNDTFRRLLTENNHRKPNRQSPVGDQSHHVQNEAQSAA